MGIDYSFDMWVPEDALYDFFKRLAQLDGGTELASLIWPDGRRLQYERHRSTVERDVDLVPFGFATENDHSFCLALPFKVDDEVRRYSEMMRAYWQQMGWDENELRSIREDGTFAVGCIHTYANLTPFWIRWFEGERIYVQITFMAATSSISHLFSDSDSVQRFFRDLTVESEGIYCTLDREGLGEEVIYSAEETGEMPLGWMCGHWREPKVRPDVSEREALLIQQSRFLNSLVSQPTVEQTQRVISFTKSDEPGLRAHAYSTLSRIDPSLALPVLKLGLQDEHWRVRAGVAYALGELRVPKEIKRWPGSIEPLLSALQDPHFEVRTVAADQSRYFDDPLVFETQLRLFNETPLTPENLGVVKEVLHGLSINKAGWDASQEVEKRSKEPGFPFPKLAQSAIEVLKTRPQRH